MEKIQNPKHPTQITHYSLSRLLERASYYGLRSLVILYMVGETLHMEDDEAFSIYGWFTGSLIFSQIIGAFMGDLLIGNRKAILLGGILQAIGAFCLSLPSLFGLYAGLFLVVLGSGFFTPNIISNFGKLYLNNSKLLDSGYTIFYLAVNLGSFLGVLCMGYLNEKVSYRSGFIIAGIMMLLSLTPILISKEKTTHQLVKSNSSIVKRILNILIAFFAIGLFWGVYEISGIRIFDLQFQFKEISSFYLSEYLWETMNSVFIFPISLIAIVGWTYVYSHPFFKLMIGFIFGIIALGILFLIPEIPTEQHVITYLVSLFFLGVSEIHIAPVIYSILTKYTNPKYLAIMVSLAFIPTRLFHIIFSVFNDKFYENPLLPLKIGIFAMTFVLIGIISYLLLTKKPSR